MAAARPWHILAGLSCAACLLAPAGVQAQVLTVDDLALNVRINLEARDDALSVLLLYTLRTRQAGRIRLTSKRPLVLPLLAPALRRQVLDRGVIPKGARHVQVKTHPGTKVETHKGSMVFTGDVVSGRPIDFRLAYPLACLQQEIDLGMRGVVGETTLAIAAIGVAPVRMRMMADRAARTANHEQGGERYSALSLTRPLRRGETAIIRVSDVPAPARWPGRTLAGVAMLMALGIGSGLFRRREREEATGS